MYAIFMICDGRKSLVLKDVDSIKRQDNFDRLALYQEDSGFRAFWRELMDIFPLHQHTNFFLMTPLHFSTTHNVLRPFSAQVHLSAQTEHDREPIHWIFRTIPTPRAPLHHIELISKMPARPDSDKSSSSTLCEQPTISLVTLTGRPFALSEHF